MRPADAAAEHAEQYLGQRRQGLEADALGAWEGSSCRTALLLRAQHSAALRLENELPTVTAAVSCCRVCMAPRCNVCLLKPPPCMLGLACTCTVSA